MSKRKTTDFSFQRFFNPDKFNPLDSMGKERRRSGINQARKVKYNLLWKSVGKVNKFKEGRGTYRRREHGRLKMSNES